MSHAESMSSPVINIADVPSKDMDVSEKFGATLARIAPLVGLSKLGMMLTRVKPGKRAFPFHAHHGNDEAFFILHGTGDYRFGDQTLPIKKGDVLGAPAGGSETAHQIINTGDTELVYLAISTTTEPEVVEYPDSGKFAMFSQTKPGEGFMSARLKYVGREENSLDYWDGEA